MRMKRTMTTLAGLAIAGLALAGCAGDTGADAPVEETETTETQAAPNAAVSTVCTTEGGAEFTILDFGTSWNFSSPGDAIAECTGTVLVEGELNEEQAAAADALGTEDLEEIAPLYGYCAHPEFAGLIESDQEQAAAALHICPEHPLADQIQ